MHRKFEKLLHEYKVEVFQDQHANAQEYAEQCMHVAEDVLNQKYSYHFHKLPDADRAEIINMINNYTREAILPPVVEKLVERQMVTERRVVALEGLLENVLKELSVDPSTVSSAS